MKSIFPDCTQVRELKLENKSDLEIWNYAKQNSFTIVTFDADFYDFVTLYGHPPKVIWLRVGNTTTSKLIEVITEFADTIKSFVSDADYKHLGCMEID